MIEIKDISGCEGLYRINTLGEVFSIARIDKSGLKFLSARKLIPLKRNNYEYVVLYKTDEKSDIAVHRLMCLTFLPNPENKPCVNHKNGIRNDNRIENLEWTTWQENAQHAHDTGLQVGIRNEKHYASRPVLQFSLDGVFIKEWPSCEEVQRQTGFSHAHISKCRSGQRATAYKFKWK